VRKLVAVLPLLFACGSKLEIDVELVNPCNRDVLAEVDFLRFEPRGQDIDSAGLARVEPIDSKTAIIPVVPASDFQLVVTGHKGSFDGPAAAAGVSPQYDLVATDGPISIQVPMALLDDFYKTTNLEKPDTCSAMSVARYGATATFVPQNGRVIIIGGATVLNGNLDYKRTIEAYNPFTGTFDAIAELPFGGQRAFHTATLLTDGRILVVGGEARVEQSRNSLRSALIVDTRDLAKVQIMSTAALRDERTGHTAVRLADGRVLVAGGRKLNPGAIRSEDHTYLDTIEIYDPARGLFVVPGGTGVMSARRFAHSGTVLKTGRDVVIAGGFNEAGPATRAEVIRVMTDNVTIVPAAEDLGVGAIHHAAGLAEDGRVLFSGGYGAIADAEPQGGAPLRPSSSVEMWSFNDATGQIAKACTSQLNVGRGFHSVSMVGRRAVFVGGRDPTGATSSSAEVATLSTGAGCFAAIPAQRQMADDRAQHTAVQLGTGEVLIVGGLTQSAGQELWSSVAGVEVFSPAREF
jgi:hypothetical protein